MKFSLLWFLTVCAAIAVALALSWDIAGAQNGSLIWAKRVTGNANVSPGAIAVDDAGNSYVGGSFFNGAVFGPGEPNSVTLNSGSGLFVAKHGPTGAFAWVSPIGVVGGARIYSIAADGAGNSYVTGRFDGTLSLGKFSISTEGENDIFVAKYAPDGAVAWVRRAGGPSGSTNPFRERGSGIAVDTSGNVYVTGSFQNWASFGEVDLTAVAVCLSCTNAFVAKYDSIGALQWAKRIGEIESTFVSVLGGGIGVDASGNAYISGNFTLTAVFGPGEVNQTSLTSAGGVDIYLAKYNSSGQLQWAKQAPGAGGDLNGGIAVDDDGNCFVSGWFDGTATFGPGEANQTVIVPAGSNTSDVFLARYDSSGAFRWVKQIGADGNDAGGAVAVDSSGNAYVTGMFEQTIILGFGEANETSLAVAGDQDIFLAKYDSGGGLRWAKQAGGAADDFVSGIDVSGGGNFVIAGMFQGSVIFGLGESNQTTLTARAGFDAFDMYVAKFSGFDDPVTIACPASSLQSAIEGAVPGQSIVVSGTCSENLLVRNEKQRITIDGNNNATITGPNANVPTINVRGKGILIQNFAGISGGSHGVHVNRGSNAVLNNNLIQNTGGNGVLIDELAFAVMTNNTIQNNPGAGVFVGENSTARIGFNADGETAAAPNTIQNNAIGVVVSNGSSARIIGNNILNNSSDGVQVVRESHADIASNAISGNGGDGVEIAENSSVQLGEDSGSGIYESANTTTSANTGVGIRCAAGGAADGRLGSLNGTSGPSSIDGSCGNSLIP